MTDIILFHFEQSEVRFVGTAEKPEWVAADICKILGVDTSEAINGRSSRSESGLDEDEKGTAIVSTPGGEQEMLTVTQSGVFQLIFKSRKPQAKRLKRWLAHQVLPAIAKTGSYSVESDRQKLERKFLPAPTTQDRIDALKLLKQGGHKKEYIQRVSIQMAKAVCHDIEAPQPQELASLPTAKALLTPTDIAIELAWFCKSNSSSGDARRVNQTLASLGYQSKIAGVWSAVQKAIDLNLCDRKPVETGSRTQKDQLMWSADILPILQEHSAEPV